MSFLKSLFRLGAEKAASTPETIVSESYKGFTIKAITMRAGIEYQLSGVIEKEIAGAVKSAQLIRADRFATVEDAARATLLKGRRLIDEQGEKLFD